MTFVVRASRLLEMKAAAGPWNSCSRIPLSPAATRRYDWDRLRAPGRRRIRVRLAMQDVPEQLDGATVLLVAPATSGQVGHSSETGEPVAVAYYAIAHYPSDGPRAYLFGVSAAHEVVSDDLWDSIEEAKSVAVRSGMVEPSAWRPRG
jgi:hypothetical protein